MPAVALPKVGKRCHHGGLQPFAHIARGRDGHGCRLLRKRHRHQTHHHRRGHHQVSGLPSQLLVAALAHGLLVGGDPQHASAGPNHGQAVTGLVARGQRGLQPGIGRFNAKRVQRNVLRGRRKRHHQSAHHQGRQAIARVLPGHARHPGHDGQLRQQQPTAPPPQPRREERQGQAVHQGGPHPFKAISQTDPTEVANGAAVNARFAQAKAQGAQHQQQRQAGGKAQRQHAQAGRLAIHLQRVPPFHRCHRGGWT